MIKLKQLLFEVLSVEDAVNIFSKFGVHNSNTLSKGELKKQWLELVKKYPIKNPLKIIYHRPSPYEIPE